MYIIGSVSQDNPDLERLIETYQKDKEPAKWGSHQPNLEQFEHQKRIKNELIKNTE